MPALTFDKGPPMRGQACSKCIGSSSDLTGLGFLYYILYFVFHLTFTLQGRSLCILRNGANAPGHLDTAVYAGMAVTDHCYRMPT
jgi:hypothetical protein